MTKDIYSVDTSHKFAPIFAVLLRYQKPLNCKKMFKQLAAAALLLAVMARTLRGVVIVCEYYANQAVFARYCENKAKPVLKCNGKCQLARKLQKEEKAPMPELNASPRFDILSSRSFFGQLQAPPAPATHAFGIPVSEGDPIKFTRSIFHPPSFV